jgi:hypothetical protein
MAWGADDLRLDANSPLPPLPIDIQSYKLGRMSNSYSVSLQVWHPDADPESIIGGIGLSAKRFWKVGDKRVTPKGTVLDGSYLESYCVFDLGVTEGKELSDFLEEAIDSLDSACAFISQLRQTGGKVSFFVAWERGDGRGEAFDIALLSRMVRAGIDLGIQPIW